MEFIEAPAFTRYLSDYLFPMEHQIWLMTVYDKEESDDLNTGQKKLLREAIELEKKSHLRTRSKT